MDIGYSPAPARAVARPAQHGPADVDWRALASWSRPAGPDWVVVGVRADDAEHRTAA